jgi:hypothetical protein
LREGEGRRMTGQQSQDERNKHGTGELAREMNGLGCWGAMDLQRARARESERGGE